VIEFCSRKVRLSLTTSQQAFKIATVRTRDDGRFTFSYVPRKSKVGAGLWRLRARMRCESGKDGSTIFRRASVRFRIKN
jgi:5-hydroxyisourate hydrolase-like protein (transthyretin family)